MSVDYLWDGSGPEDPVVRELEETLAPLRHDAGAAPTSAPRRTSFAPRLAAAVLLLMAGISLIVLVRMTSRPASWSVALVSGQTDVDRLAVGDWLETDARTSVEVDVADIGTVTLRPNSRLRLLATAKREHRLELAEGSIEAFITAPPRLFFVETASATAVDLGCAYDLTVDEAGNGTLDVTLGSVALERSGLTSTIPAGARCLLRAEIGPGTPFFADASEAFRTALERLDFGKPDDESLDTVLGAATERDTLTLWHLIPRVEGGARRDVVDRLLALAPAAGDAGRMMTLDPTALEDAWNELELDW